MTNYLFFSIQNGISYDQLKKPLTFGEDWHGFSNWVLRFPLTIYSANLYEKHVFREDSVTISAHSGIIQEQKWSYFVTTSHDGSHLYCTAQVFYEKGLLRKTFSCQNGQGDPVTEEVEQFYLPKCLILMSDQPYFKIHVNLLRIYRQILKPRPSISHPINPRIISKYLTLKAQGHRQQFFLENHTEALSNAKTTTILDYYISKVNQHSMGESILVEKETNVPILHLYKLNNNELFQFSHFFNLPLSSHTVATLLTALLLQKQIIIASKSNNLVVMIIESLLQMVQPLKWQHMIVHHLPEHLLDAANQNFMPFLVGVNQKCLHKMNKENKFILMVEEDRVVEPQKMPEIGPPMNNFMKVISKTDSPSIRNERNILQHSIEFVCSLLKPLLSKRDTIDTHPFYSEFLQTLTCQYFIERVDKQQLSQFIDLLQISTVSERKVKIERELTQLTYYFHNPKFLYNEQEWIEYYLDKNNPLLKKDKKRQASKIVTLKEIKESTINEHSYCRISKKNSAAITRIRSQSAMQPRSRSNKKIKVSVLKHDHCHPLLNQLLEHRLGVAQK